MKFIDNMMRANMLLLLGCLLWFGTALIPLEKQELDGKYEIGTIKQLFFSQKEKILFRSDDDLFGFISQKDGSLLAVYELEEGERILQFAHGMEVIIAKDKKVNIFWPHRGAYVRSYQTKFLDKHPDFTQLLDFLRTPKGTLLLTDKYLMRIPIPSKGTKLGEIKEEILKQLSDSKETYFNLIDFYDPDAKQLHTYLTSLLKNEKTGQVCFHKISENDTTSARKCFDLLQGENVQEIISSARFIYVELEDGAIVLNSALEIIERIDSVPVQYYHGMATIGQDHHFYAPHSQSTHDARIIVGQLSNSELLTLKVEATALTVQKMETNDNNTFDPILTIPKEAEAELRKVWSYAKKGQNNFRLYLQFQEGRLVCYEVDRATQKYKEAWEFITIPAKKVPTAQIEQEDLQAGEPTDETVEEEQAEEAEAAKEEAKDEDADINENEKVDPAKAKP